MFRSLVPRLFAPAARHHLLHPRLFSAQVPSAAAPSEPLPPSPAQNQAAQSSSSSAAAGSLPYRVPRNTRGSVPALVQDLKNTLFPEGSEEAARLKITTDRQQRVVISGGRWKKEIIAWLVKRGF
ncbi:hypothetical protein FKP32DRAFT_1570515 [Trametes sanguinea]|nr:hypothetical protein FKP32DRAFT_1570515 [Trametes sanguinea]